MTGKVRAARGLQVAVLAAALPGLARPGDARVRLSVTAGLAAETFVGPLFAGASVGDGGAYHIYFTLGELFR